METVTVSSKGQIVIPKALRKAFDIVRGTQFVISAEGDGIRLRPASIFKPTRAADGLGLLAGKGRKQLDDEQTKRAIAVMLAKRDRGAKAR